MPSITNTLFPGKCHRKVAWCNPRSKAWHKLDFVIVKTKVLNTRTYHSADCDTDHLLVVSKMRLQSRPYHRQKKFSRKIDDSEVTLYDLSEKYGSILQENLNEVPENSEPDALWSNLKTVIYNAALETFGEKKNDKTRNGIETPARNFILS